jgi:CRISPR-associated protein Cas1
LDDRLRQLQAASDPQRCLDFARAFVHGKIANQRVLLSRRARRHRDQLREHEAPIGAIERLSDLLDEVDRASSVSQVLGFEGAATAVYLKAWREMLDPVVGFHKRDRRGHDVVNALLNYTSALLRERLVTAITTAGLDPRISFLHSSYRGRPSLAFDLMEEWRPVLAESTVLSLVQLRAVGPDDLESEARAAEGAPRLLLTAEARGRAIQRFEDRLGTEFRPRNGNTARTFADWIDAQVFDLRRCLRDPSAAYTPVKWR